MMKTFLSICLLALSITVRAEDGYELWLRYHAIQSDTQANYYRRAASEIVPSSDSPTLEVAGSELARGLRGLLGAVPPVAAEPTQDGSIIFGTPESSSVIEELKLPIDRTGAEGYL